MNLKVRPLVTVIIPCFNQGIYLSQTLISVHEQIFSDFECIIINDGSSDNSQEIIDSWVKLDSRFISINTSNNGVSSARNLGLQNANGKFIQFLDADDLIDPEKLSKSMELFNKNRVLSMVVSDFSMFHKNLDNIYEPYCNLGRVEYSFEYFLLNWQVSFSLPIHCPLFKFEDLDEIRFDTDLSAQEDRLFWLKFMKKDPVVAITDKKWAFYRYNPEGRSKNEYGVDDELFTDKLKVNFGEDDYERFLRNKIRNQKDKMDDLKNRIRTLKDSNSYQFILMVKKVLRMVHLESFSRLVMKYLRKFKKSIS